MNQPCPLCGQTAKFAQIDSVRKHFRCPQCTEFLLWADAELSLPQRAPFVREGLAAEVKNTTDPNSLYVIRQRFPDSAPHIDLEGRSLPRSQALAPVP